MGVAVVETPDEATARAILANDPVEKAGLSRIEIYPMGAGTIVRESGPSGFRSSRTCT